MQAESVLRSANSVATYNGFYQEACTRSISTASSNSW